MSEAPRSLSRLLPSLLAAILLFAYALKVALGTFDPPDLYIYRFGALLASQGQTPYDIAAIRDAVTAQNLGPEPEKLRVNCGFFLPPLAVLVYLPLAIVSWAAAKLLWALVILCAAFAIACLPWFLRPRDEPLSLVAKLVIPFVLVCNPLAMAVVLVGQTSILFAGCVAAGLWAFGRDRPYLGALFWVIPFIKPHLALALIPLAWYLGGWRPAALLVLLVAALNLVGATIIGGTPLFLKEYIDFLPAARTAVDFNRVEMNPSVISWNSLLYRAGGPLIEMTLAITLGSYLVWFGLVVGRCAAAGEKPSAAWAAAAAAVGATMCSQALVYELFFLTAATPWIRDLFAAGYRIRGALAAFLIAWHLIPHAAMSSYGIPFHHPLAVILLAVVVLSGPATRIPAPYAAEAPKAA